MPRSLLLRGSRSKGRKATKAASPGDSFFSQADRGLWSRKTTAWHLDENTTQPGLEKGQLGETADL